MNVGMIGVGNMGSRIAARLARSHKVWGFDIIPEKVARLKGQQVSMASSAAEIVNKCNAVFMSLPGPKEVVDTVCGRDGILARNCSGLIVVDLTTSSPDATKLVASHLSAAGARFLEMPVSGGVVAAEQGDLTAFASGPPDLHAEIAPVVGLFTKKRTFLGEYGKASVLKLLNNRIALQCMFLDTESLVIGAKCGIDPMVALNALDGGSATNAQLQRLRQHLFPPNLDCGFPCRLAVKDLGLIHDLECLAGASTAGTTITQAEFEAAVEAGYGELDQSAICRIMERRLGQTITTE